MAEDTPPVAWVTAGLEAVIAHHKGQRDAYWNCPSSGEVRAVIAAVVMPIVLSVIPGVAPGIPTESD